MIENPEWAKCPYEMIAIFQGKTLPRTLSRSMSTELNSERTFAHPVPQFIEVDAP